MEKDPRYKALKILIEAGYIEYIKDIFTHIPKSIIRADIGTNTARMTRLISDPSEFTIKELYKIASLINVDPIRIVNLVHSQISIGQKKTKEEKVKENKKNV
jgi:hypothetical protein